MRLHISEHSARAFETLTQRIAERLARPPGHDFIRKSDIARIHVNTTSRRNANAHDGFAMRKSLGTHVIDKVENARKHDFPTLLRIGRNRALRKNDGCSIGVFITHDGTRNFRSAHINSNNAEWIFQRKTSKTIPIAQRRDRGFPQKKRPHAMSQPLMRQKQQTATKRARLPIMKPLVFHTRKPCTKSKLMRLAAARRHNASNEEAPPVRTAQQIYIMPFCSRTARMAATSSPSRA